MRTYGTIISLLAFFASILALPNALLAQEARGLVFTVTPPLFQLSLKPGESWTSGVQVVNGNAYDMTVYAEPVLFRPSGEEGMPEFFRADDPEVGAGSADDTTLSGWITVPRGAIEIAREQTEILPIAIDVPADAAPGGHYAAILIGNRAPRGTGEGGTVKVSSSIASLIFLRVAGDVDERGRIRDFVTERSVYERAEARLSLRFENQGNVHLQPQGDVTIYNMFNKKRGYIPVNQSRDYGNVLPGSMRKYTFSWQSEAGSWDIGRYRAEVTLGYGAEEKQFATATVYFWVLPLVPLAQVLFALVAFVWFVGWSVRSYVRRAITIERARSGIATPPEAGIPETEEQKLKLGTLIRPLQAGMVDLRSASRIGAEQGMTPYLDREVERPSPRVRFVREYRFFFLFIIVLGISWFAASAFFADVLTVERPFTAAEERRGEAVPPLSPDLP